MSGSAATPDESGAQPWVGFLGFGAIFCSRDQMMVSFTTEARVGFCGREPSVGSLAVAAGKAAGGSVVSAMPWLDLLIAPRSDQIQADPLPSALF
jgi:hypothetical protein